MREELDKKLCEKYPEIFKDRNASMQETVMCWGFTCDDGWFSLIDTLCSLIMWHCTENLHLKPEGKPLPIPVAVQVKEKFGTLRFYIRGGDDTIDTFIQFARAMSARICEECGATNGTSNKNRGGWWMTRCPNCAPDEKETEND